MTRGYVRISDIRMEPVVEIEASIVGGYASGITTWEASLCENLTDAETDSTLELVSLCEERQTYDEALASLKARLDDLDKRESGRGSQRGRTDESKGEE